MNICAGEGTNTGCHPTTATPETLPWPPQLTCTMPSAALPLNGSETPSPLSKPLPCHLEQVLVPRCSVPLSPALGRSPLPAVADGLTMLPGLGEHGEGNALRPRTHFIPSHLYWISRINGLRELVYPIKLHCRGHLCPASLPGAMGCSVGRAGGEQREAQAAPKSQQPPLNSRHTEGLLAHLGVADGEPRSPVLPSHQIQTSGPAGTHTRANTAPTSTEEQGTNSPSHRAWQQDTGHARRE